jgi:hypothetical protein
MTPIDRLHINIHSSIELAAALMKMPCIADIIRLCQMTPKNLIDKNHSNELYYNSDVKTTSHYYSHWVDPFGHVMKLNKSHGWFEIQPYIIGARSENIYNRDMYAGLSIAKIAKISKFIDILFGKDIDLEEDYIVLTFLGIDDKLRTYVYIYGEWESYPSLLIGSKALRDISENKAMSEFKEIRAARRIIYECSSQKRWLSALPLPKELSIMIDGNDAGYLVSEVLTKGKL